MRRGFLACNVFLAGLPLFGGLTVLAQDAPTVETAPVEADAATPGVEHQRLEPFGQRPDAKTTKLQELTAVRTGSTTASSSSDDLARIQGTWERTYPAGGGSTGRAVKTIDGTKETVTRYVGGRVVQVATVDIQVERQANVCVLTFSNLEIVGGPNKGHKNPTAQSYIYRVDKETFTEVWGLLAGQPGPVNVMTWKRVQSPTTAPTQTEDVGFFRRMLRNLGGNE